MRQSTTQASAQPAPHVPAHWPLVGHAVAFGADPDAFLARCQARHGSAFTVALPGGKRTFLTDPFDFPALFQNKALVFRDLGTQIGGRVFGYDYKTALERWGMEELGHQISVHFKGDELRELTERMHTRFVARLEAAVGASWCPDRLFRFVNEHVFAAGIDALFGDGCYSPDVHAAYSLLDRNFSLLMLGVPSRLLPGVRAAQTRLAEAISVPRPDRCRLLQVRAEHYEKHEVPVRQRGYMDATLIWASQANTVATAFWTLSFILRDPTARAAILDEVRSLTARGPLSYELLREMHQLDSAISETMRLTSLPILVRRVVAPTELSLASGTLLRLSPGDELCVYPHAMHLDPEIYADPYTFRYDRFITVDGPKHFTKGGQRVQFPLLPFGAGASTCPGRFFARNEFKIVVATLLSSFDVELSSTAMPDLNFRRVGLGVPPPSKDLPFRLRRRLPS